MVVAPLPILGSRALALAQSSSVIVAFPTNNTKTAGFDLCSMGALTIRKEYFMEFTRGWRIGLTP